MGLFLLLLSPPIVLDPRRCRSRQIALSLPFSPFLFPVLFLEKEAGIQSIISEMIFFFFSSNGPQSLMNGCRMTAAIPPFPFFPSLPWRSRSLIPRLSLSFSPSFEDASLNNKKAACARFADRARFSLLPLGWSYRLTKIVLS